MIDFNRRRLLIALGGGLIAARSVHAQPVSADIAQRLADAEQGGRVFGLHALLVNQGGKLVFAHYEKGNDEARGRPLGEVAFAPDVLHDLRSVSKSIVGLAYGIALADGKVPPPEAKLYEPFPEYADLAGQPGRDRLTIHNVLSMTLGLQWDELSIPYGTPGNSEDAMDAAPDRFRYILEQPIVTEPGTKWTYCGGATALLGRLIAKGTGDDLPTYCRRVLFDPLQFGAFEWHRDRHGDPIAASGLRLLPPDLLKIGQLMLASGEWNGRRVVPADWIKRVTTPVVKIDAGRSYGYQWYMGDMSVGTPPQPDHWFGGIGWGGQRLYVVPARDVVTVIHCGNYNRPGMEQARVIRTIMSEAVLPNLASRT
ncbi:MULTISPECIES: serine hydrolase [unclassified Bradyrhizobium]|uniref:serine hydrolase domain-containing protein n=1 Tax=unclassified Bradyrhizobium TaxID=2631580 RepID=UPI0028ECC9F4|nr:MULTISPECIES: serine hydrolase [unclassified Bradyrhizobium]